jgi:hypothetical protein
VTTKASNQSLSTSFVSGKTKSSIHSSSKSKKNTFDKKLVENNVSNEQLQVKKSLQDYSIKEENKKVLARLLHMEKEGGKAEFTYDHEGRILLLKKAVANKGSPSQGCVFFYLYSSIYICT